jgi:antitoxin component of MazEF toxin-antitoxin module
MRSKLLRHGNSSAVIIPAAFLKGLSVKRGDKIELYVDYSKARITITFPEARQLRLVVDSSRKKDKILR